MRRREFISLLCGAAAAWPLVARGQQKRPLIGLLSIPSRPVFERDRAAFLRGLSEGGYVEDRDFDLAERYVDGYLDRLPALANELVQLKPNVILAENSSAAIGLRQFTTAIPIVVGVMADPVRLGLVASEARPGGNVTGILVNLDGLPGKLLQLAAELVPGATKIGFLFNLKNPGMAFQRPEIEAAASALGLKVVTAGIGSPDDLDTAFSALTSADVGSVMVGQDGTFYSQRNQIGNLAAAARLPWVSGYDFAEAGAVIGYGVNLPENFRRAGAFVAKILKGVKPADIPVELPTKVGMVINLKSAKALGLAVSPALLNFSDKVIE